MAELTHLEKRRIQMEYVVPLVRGLQEILGEDTVRDALETLAQRRLDEAFRRRTGQRAHALGRRR